MKILDETGVPMMSNEEVLIINHLLQENNCKVCLEWGSGNSTVYFPKENSCVEKWISVEHNKTYYELLNDKLVKNKAVIIVMPDRQKYVDYPKTLGIKFDFVIILKIIIPKSKRLPYLYNES